MTPLRALIDYFMATRRRGHTTAMLKGAINTPDCIVVCATRREAYRLWEMSGSSKKDNFISIDEIATLKGLKAPLLIDHYALGLLVDDLLRLECAAKYHICSSRDGYPDPDDELRKALDALEGR